MSFRKWLFGDYKPRQTTVSKYVDWCIENGLIIWPLGQREFAAQLDEYENHLINEGIERAINELIENT